MHRSSLASRCRSLPISKGEFQIFRFSYILSNDRREWRRFFAFIPLWAFIGALCGLTGSCAKKSSSSSEGESQSGISSGAQPVNSQESGGGAASANPLDAKYVRQAVSSLSSRDFILDNIDADNIRTPLALLASAAVSVEGGGQQTITFEWKINNSSIDSRGVVNRPAFGLGNSTGTIQVIARRGASTAFKSFPVTVLQIDPTDSEAVNTVKNELNEDYVKLANISLNRVQTNLRLPATLYYGTTITWSSTLPSISSSGVVTRPSYTTLPANANGTITATISKGTSTVTKTLSVRVMRALPPLLITEVTAEIGNTDGYVEVLNTTNAPIDLGEYEFWTCDAQPTCALKENQLLPSQSLAAGAYVQIKPRAVENLTPNSSSIIYISSMLLFYQTDYFELTKSGATVDFVKWRNSDSALTNPTPITGTFTGVVRSTAVDPTKSIGRVYPLEDSDGIAEWVNFVTNSPGMTNGTGAPPGSDSDGDGLSDDVEVSQSFTNPFNPDTDGDGFTDGQEWLPSGVGGLNIKALGANPLVRDIFLEIDYMAPPAGAGDNKFDATGSSATLAIRRKALEKVRDTFQAFSPTQNDANPYPIKLHIDAGSLFDPADGLNEALFDLGGGNQIPFTRCLYLGTDALRNASNCGNLYDIKLSHFSSARLQVFHYMVIGWSMEVDGVAGNSGLAEIPGNDSIVTIGGWGNLPEQMIVNWQAATILHELGHNLGLDHGGFQAANYKPNYVSSMNYMYQLNGLDTDRNGDVFYFEMGPQHPRFSDVLDNPHYSTSFQIGFSRGGASILNESSLSEASGIGGVAIDFNGNNTIDGGSIAANIQPDRYNKSSSDSHRDFDDWANLKFKFQGLAGFNLSSHMDFNLSTDSHFDEQPVSSECLTIKPQIPFK